MAAVFSEDDRDYFNKFTNARNTSHVGADVLEEVRSVLSNKKFSTATRLAAAKLLVHAQDTLGSEVRTRNPLVDWVVLTAMLEAADMARITKIIRIWMVCFERRRIRDSDDEALFLASLAKILSKKAIEVNDSFTAEERKRLRRYLLVTYVILAELDRGSKFFDGAVHFVAKTFCEQEKLLDFCLEELSVRLRGRYGILRIFLRENCAPHEARPLNENIMEKICGQLRQQLHSQLITNAAADLIAALVMRFPTSTVLLELFLENVTHHLKCIRSNVLRWFGRIDVAEESCKFFEMLRDSLREKFLRVGEDIWPPRLWETEDVSCIDPRWDCEESEDVLWEADRALDAYLNVSGVLQQRFHHEIDQSDMLIQAGLKWHLPEIRLSSFRLWTTTYAGKTIEQTKNNSYLEEFILANGMSSSTNLRKAVEAVSSTCNMTEEGSSKWNEMLDRLTMQAKVDEEQRNTSYLPVELNDADLLPLPPPQQAKDRLEELLKISGSIDVKSCPAFPELYENLAKAGYNQRVFARFIIDLINLVKSYEDAKTALDVIAGAVTRCRLKVVVDHGCTVIDELLSLQHSEEHFFYLVEYRYCWAMNRLIDRNTQCRTLPLSRILWSVCEKSRDLLQICFDSCRSTLSDSSLDSKVHERVIKTLKLFASKSDCKMPADFVEFLFWHCIDAQEHSEFLIRSAATILFGFVVRYITKSRVVPAFFIVSTRAKFWRDMAKRCFLLPEVPSLQRILLLSFLTRLTLGNIECYSITVQEEIEALLHSVTSLMGQTRDIRERRFCLEIAVAMSSSFAHGDVLKLLKERKHNEEGYVLRADCDFLEYALKTFDCAREFLECKQIPIDLLESPYVKIIENSRNWDHTQAVMDIQKIFASVKPHSAELTLQALAMALTRIAVNLRNTGNVDSSTRNQLVSQCCSILDHPGCTSRAASIISRIPVCLGLTRNYYQKQYVVQILKQWEDSNSE